MARAALAGPAIGGFAREAGEVLRVVARSHGGVFDHVVGHRVGFLTDGVPRQQAEVIERVTTQAQLIVVVARGQARADVAVMQFVAFAAPDQEILVLVVLRLLQVHKLLVVLPGMTGVVREQSWVVRMVIGHKFAVPNARLREREGVGALCGILGVIGRTGEAGLARSARVAAAAQHRVAFGRQVAGEHDARGQTCRDVFGAGPMTPFTTDDHFVLVAVAVEVDDAGGIAGVRGVRVIQAARVARERVPREVTPGAVQVKRFVFGGGPCRPAIDRGGSPVGVVVRVERFGAGLQFLVVLNRENVVGRIAAGGVGVIRAVGLYAGDPTLLIDAHAAPREFDIVVLGEHRSGRIREPHEILVVRVFEPEPDVVPVRRVACREHREVRAVDTQPVLVRGAGVISRITVFEVGVGLVSVGQVTQVLNRTGLVRHAVDQRVQRLLVPAHVGRSRPIVTEQTGARPHVGGRGRRLLRQHHVDAQFSVHFHPKRLARLVAARQDGFLVRCGRHRMNEIRTRRHTLDGVLPVRVCRGGIRTRCGQRFERRLASRTRQRHRVDQGNRRPGQRFVFRFAVLLDRSGHARGRERRQFQLHLDGGRLACRN